jgi:hypothetical protein
VRAVGRARGRRERAVVVGGVAVGPRRMASARKQREEGRMTGRPSGYLVGLAI